MSRIHLAGFITHHFSAANYTSSTIYPLFQLCLCHKIVELTDPADNCYIKKRLVGVKKSSEKVNLRSPIDLHMLGQLVKVSKTVIPEQFTKLYIYIIFLFVPSGT